MSAAIGDFLPAALAVALSPIPIIAVVLILGTAKASSTGPAFAVGWVGGLAAVSALVLLLTAGASGTESTASEAVEWGKVAIGALFLYMAVKQWGKRPRRGEEVTLPKWMATLDDITPGRAAILGVTLSGANPKNLALTLSATATIAMAGLDGAEEVIAVAVFVLIGSLSVLGAVLFHAMAGDRATAPLASIKDFMTANNAVIMMVILLLLGAKLIGDGLGGLGS
jgi:threonine/homoserine/homoserine lactone efflux protein